MGVCASNRACEPGADDSPTPPAPRECWVNILPREEIAFPMYVVKAMHVMTMTEVEPHQAPGALGCVCVWVVLPFWLKNRPAQRPFGHTKTRGLG